jgi:hypothetical protein
MIHPELPDQPINPPESAVPTWHAAGWRTASDDEIAEYRTETRVVGIPYPDAEKKPNQETESDKTPDTSDTTGPFPSDDLYPSDGLAPEATNPKPHTGTTDAPPVSAETGKE